MNYWEQFKDACYYYPEATTFALTYTVFVLWMIGYAILMRRKTAMEEKKPDPPLKEENDRLKVMIKEAEGIGGYRF